MRYHRRLISCRHRDKCGNHCGAHAALREVVPNWEGVRRILASLAEDPGRQGQKLIRVKHGVGWECQREVTQVKPGDPAYCYHDTPEVDGKVPEVCELCGYWRLKRVTISIPYLAEQVSGGGISDPFMAANFKVDLYRSWVQPLFGVAGLELVHYSLYGGFGDREAARLAGMPYSTARDMLARVARRYDAP
jgi:hypothetical protein